MVRSLYEPTYPASLAELDEYCSRFVGGIRDALGDRLVCILLCGSWARDEAKPGVSDVDLTIVVDTVDAELIARLRRAWSEAELGCANVYGADEIGAMVRECVEMYTTNARVLWGRNPFRPPTTADFNSDLARIAEAVARDARCLLLYDWLTVQERDQRLAHLTGRYGLQYALKCVVALRTGRFPKTLAEMRALLNQREAEWVDAAQSARGDAVAQRAVAQQLSDAAHSWLLQVGAC